MSSNPQDGRRTLSEAELLRVTLASVGDAVITTDQNGRVTMLNSVAQRLTGWEPEAAVGDSLEKVFRTVNQDTRAEVANPALRALREGVVVDRPNQTLLLSKDGTERPIEDSAVPIRDAQGELAGAMLVFRDITERRRQERLVREALDHTVNIINTLRHAFLVLDKDLRVVSANRAFYNQFQMAPDATEGRLVYELSDGQWNIPKLRQLLEEILTQDRSFEDFEVAHDFPHIGQKRLVLNARRVKEPGNQGLALTLSSPRSFTLRAS